MCGVDKLSNAKMRAQNWVYSKIKKDRIGNMYILGSIYVALNFLKNRLNGLCQ